VIARTRYIAEDAAALVDIDYEPLPRSPIAATRSPASAERPPVRQSNLLIEFQQSMATSRMPSRAPRGASASISSSTRAARTRSRERRGRRLRRNEDADALVASRQLAHECAAFS